MKPILLTLLLLSTPGVAVGQVPANVLKEHPRLQKICDLAHGCQNVHIECTLYDNYGNSGLRNLKWFDIQALGEEGSGWHKRDKANMDSEAMEHAISEWLENYMSKKPGEKPEVFPHHTACKLDCGGSSK